MIARVCAWCDRVLGTKPGPPGVTHAMCDSCAPKFLAGVRVIAGDETNKTTETTK